MNIVIRTDASSEIGTGHVMRCLALADKLRGSGAVVQFVSRQMLPELRRTLAKRGYVLEILDSTSCGRVTSGCSTDLQWLRDNWRMDADQTAAVIGRLDTKPAWLVLDHYAFDWRWEQHLRPIVDRIMVIDDLTDRRHECDLFLNQNVIQDARNLYEELVRKDCKMLLGPRYALLRDEFRVARESARARKGGSVRNLLVFFGGVDSENLTGVAIEALAALQSRDLDVNVVIGRHHPKPQEVDAACKEYGFHCHVQTHRMADLMSEADLAIGAGGSASWERCCLGLPCITLVTAENQSQLVRNAALAGLLYAPASGSRVSANFLAMHFGAVLENPLLCESISQNAMTAVDGFGTDRVARIMVIGKVTVREAVRADSQRILEWRNHPDIRAVSRNKEPLEQHSHDAWLESTLTNEDRLLLVGESSGNPVGIVRFDILGSAAEASIYLSPERIQQGIGTELLAEAERWLKQHRPEVVQVQAEVRETNIRSHRLFAGSRYRVETTRYTKELQ